jgi:hypothetical protein
VTAEIGLTSTGARAYAKLSTESKAGMTLGYVFNA